MASLKTLRGRQKSVEATKKITSAMKMIAAAKLKRAAEHAAASRPYGDLMADMVYGLVSRGENLENAFPLLASGREIKTHLIVVLTSNRGLCGGFNTAVVRSVKQLIKQNKNQGIAVQLLCVGHRGGDQLRRDYGSLILETLDAKVPPDFYDAVILSDKIMTLFKNGQFDQCTLVFNQFVSALCQTVKVQSLIPIKTNDMTQKNPQISVEYEYEPTQAQVLEALLPRHIRFQIFRSMLESAAGEQGARMAAMDGATRNATDMIRGLELQYNRTRQAQITKELIEIISGADAL